MQQKSGMQKTSCATSATAILVAPNINQKLMVYIPDLFLEKK